MDAGDLIGNLTFWGGKILILIIFAMIWWQLWFWDVWVASFVTAGCILGAYLGYKKAKAEIDAGMWG